MTRKDVALALTISVAALLLYVGVKQVLGGHWDWVTFVIWVLGALLFGFVTNTATVSRSGTR